MLVGAALASSQPINGQEASSAYESKLQSKFTLTELTPDALSVAKEGTPVLLQKDRLVLWAQVKKRFFTPDNSYVDGAIVSGSSAAMIETQSKHGEAHIFVAGDKLWLTKTIVDPKGNGIALQFLSEPVGGVRYVGSVKFKFPKGAPPTPDQLLETVSEVIQPAGTSGDVPVKTAIANSTGGSSVTTTASTSSAPASTRTAPTGDGPDLSTLTVAGVRLGMTADEAIAALKKFETWPILKKRYDGGHLQTTWQESLLNKTAGAQTGFYGITGMSEDCKARNGAAIVRPPLLVAIIAARTNRVPPQDHFPATSDFLALTGDCTWSGAAVSSKTGEDPEEVTVYLSPTPGNERVIAVTFWRLFGKQPTVESVLAGAAKRYPLPVLSVTELSDGKWLSWRSDAQNRLFTGPAFKNAKFSVSNLVENGGAAGLPPSINANLGIGLDFYVGLARDRDIARSYQISLFSQRGLFDFTKQARLAQADIDQRIKQTEVDKAKSNTVDIR